jgi:hypothetical protein
VTHGSPKDRVPASLLVLGLASAIVLMLADPAPFQSRNAGEPVLEQAAVEEAADRHVRHVAQRPVRRLEALLVHPLERVEVVGQYPV